MSILNHYESKYMKLYLNRVGHSGGRLVFFSYARNKNGEHAGKRNDKTLGKQNDKTSGKTKLQNRRENKMTEQNIMSFY